MVYLSRRYRFSAAHRLDNAALSPEENARIYGKCNNPLGHGHNYVLEVTVAGRVDPATGMVMNLSDLDSADQREVIERFDETHLNLDGELFRERVPTTENICREIFRLLDERFRAGSAALARVRLEETNSNSVDYGPAAGLLHAGRRKGQDP